MTPRIHLPALAAPILLLIVGCATEPGIDVLGHPVPRKSFGKGLLNPKKLSPDTRAVLAATGLTSAAKEDPVAVIKILAGKLKSNPGDTAIRVALAELCLDRAERLDNEEPGKAIGFFLAAADTAYPGLRNPTASLQHRELVVLYNQSCADAATHLFRTGHADTRNFSIQGPLGTYSLSTRTRGSDHIDPDFFDQMHPASALEIQGFRTRDRQEGVGGALVGYRAGTPERRKDNPFLSPYGMAEPLSATLTFDRAGKVELTYHDVLVDDQVRLFGKNHILEADFTATVATLLEHEPVDNVGLEGVLHPEECLPYQGLFLLHTYRPEKIPVILVHGLMSSPETWRELIDAFQDDRELRNRYQFLIYQYPTGFPIPHNGAGLSRHLKAFEKKYDPHNRNPNMNNMVMIGHSMGSLLTSIQIRDGNDDLWFKIHDTSVDEMELSKRDREGLRELIYFEANPKITRAIFVCAPHRGSKFASNFIGAIGSFLIDRSFVLKKARTTLKGTVSEIKGTILNQSTDGIKDLEMHSEVLEEIVKLPVNSNTTYHSIIGDRGKGDPLPDSSDGVVAYWSSQLDGSASEHIVPSAHSGAAGHAATIKEIRRILYLHAGVPFTAAGSAASRKAPEGGG